MLLKLYYPKNNSKVSNPEITFRWRKIRGENKYVIVIFRRIRKNEMWEWKKIFSHSLSNNFYQKSLKPGYKYHCIVTTDDVYPKNLFRTPYKHPWIYGHLQDPPISLDLNPHFSFRNLFCSTFYVKKPSNYLTKYLNIKSTKLKPNQHLGPTIPLLFYFIDRYYQRLKDPVNVKQIDQDKGFSQAMDSLPLEFRSVEKIEKLLTTYHKANHQNQNNNLFDPMFTEFPKEENAEAWINQALDTLFSETWLYKLRSAGEKTKTMDFDFKYPLFGPQEVSLVGDLLIPVKDELVGTEPRQFDMNKTYLLEIKPQSGASAFIHLHLIKEESGKYFLNSPNTDLSSYDAATFEAQLWEKDPITPESDNRLWSRGHVTINGGIPIILSIEPHSAPEGSFQEIKIKVRDGGLGKKIILKHESQTYNIPRNPESVLVRSIQTLAYQVFTFKLTDCADTIPPENYDLFYQNNKMKDSMNSVIFVVKGWEYKVWIKELKCIDESNPEWAGNDSISFQTFVNTSKFLQKPINSKVYHGFKDGKSKTRFSNNDNHIYLQPNVRRIIEEFLSINIAIYEHDDLGWLDVLINAVISFVQSFLAHLIDVFTLGLGGYIIEAGLEVSGLNDMREEAVDSMVAGMEVEVLHQGQTVLEPSTNDTYEWPLMMSTSESKYKVTFKADRVIQP